VGEFGESKPFSPAAIHTLPSGSKLDEVPRLFRMRMPHRFVSLIVISALGCSLGGCATLKKIRFPWRKKRKPVAAEAPRPQFIGTIVLVNEDARFVLIDVGHAPLLPRAGTALKSMAGETETGVVAVGDVRRRPFAIADIVRGEPRKGDRLFE